MKKLLVISVLLNVGLCCWGLCWKELAAHAAGGGVPVGNGDVNGDENYDISDAVYFLNWRFLGGPAPVPYENPELLGRIVQLEADLAAKSTALEECSSGLSTVQSELAIKTTALEECIVGNCPPPIVKGLPGTGQTKCYNATGSMIDCDSADFPGQDGFYQAGCTSGERFLDNQDGTVTDTCTGLMWQKDTADVDGNGSIGGVGDSVTWQGALGYCEKLDFAGHTDWRLPNVRELQSIVDYGQMNPSINPFFRAESGWYWSSSSSANPGFGWFCNFQFGVVQTDYINGSDSYVRAVRSGT